MASCRGTARNLARSQRDKRPDEAAVPGSREIKPASPGLAAQYRSTRQPPPGTAVAAGGEPTSSRPPRRPIGTILHPAGVRGPFQSSRRTEMATSTAPASAAAAWAPAASSSTSSSSSSMVVLGFLFFSSVAWNWECDDANWVRWMFRRGGACGVVVAWEPCAKIGCRPVHWPASAR